MVRKRRGTAAMDATAAANVRFRARSGAAAAASSSGPAKRRRRMTSEDNSTWSEAAQLRSSAGSRISVVPPPWDSTSLGEEFRWLSSGDQASVSCCSSSYGSSEMEKNEPIFVDPEEPEQQQEEEVASGEADSSSMSSSFSIERREMMKKKTTPSSDSLGEMDGGDSMDSSSEDKLLEPNPTEKSKEEIQSSVVDEDEQPSEMFSTDDDEPEPDGLPLKKARNFEIKMPSQFEIEEFFASAEASNLRELEHYKQKYNFDFVKEEALEGRFEWREVSVSAPPAQAEELVIK